MQSNKIIIAATLAVTAIFSPAAAAADTRSATDQNSQLTQAKSLTQEVMSGHRSQKSLTPSKRSLLKQYTTPGEMRVTRTPNSVPVKATARSAEYCRKDGAHFEQKALLGNTLYTYWQTVEICGAPGVKIHDVKVIDSGGETKTPTWSYEGQASPPASYPVGDGWYVRTSENFSQKIIVDNIGAGQRTVCISADIQPTGEYHASDRC